MLASKISTKVTLLLFRPPPQRVATGIGKRLAARLRVKAGVTPTVPRLACPLVALGAAEAGVGDGPGAGAGIGAGAGAGARGGDDLSGVTPRAKFAGEAPPGKVSPGEAY